MREPAQKKDRYTRGTGDAKIEPFVKLWAISDIHLGYPQNSSAFKQLTPHGKDWLILGGDVGETEDHLKQALDVSLERFSRVIWIPGNHEVWTERGVSSVEKYQRMVDLAEKRGALTPESRYVQWPDDPELYLCPMFLLYDYSFRPDDVPLDRAVAWAEEAGIACKDEYVITPSPYRSISDWCQARCEATEKRLRELPENCRTVLINHFPLREEHAVLPAIPRFKIWCGTKRTEDWHVRFRAKVVVSGHLHIRSTRMRDGVRFEEVSLGYPRQWMPDRAVDGYLREIIPGKDAA